MRITVKLELYFSNEEMDILRAFALENHFVREACLEGKSDYCARWTAEDKKAAARDAINWMVRDFLTKEKALKEIR